jgi:hypothetical protein
MEAIIGTAANAGLHLLRHGLGPPAKQVLACQGPGQDCRSL